MTRRQITILLTLIVFIGAAVLVIGALNRSNAGENSKVKVAAAFYPLYDFASKVGGDKVEVINITPAGSEPHDYEPTSKQLALVSDANLLIENGKNFQSWAEKTASDRQRSGKAVADASTGIDLIAGQPEEGEEIQPGKQLIDPHFWLDPVLASKEVDTITKALIEVSPAEKDYFEANAANYKQKLQTLNDEFAKGLANCPRHDIVTSHQAFNYMARRYKFQVLAISGLSPEEEPSPKQLADVVDFVKKNNVRYIFFEELVSPKLSDTIARETGAKTIVFNPLEGLPKDEIDQGKDYFSVQRENLANLRTALSCT